MSASFPHFAAGSADIFDHELSAKLIDNFCNVAADAATLPDGTSQASLAAATSPGIPPDAEPVPNWAPGLSPTADGHSQLAADPDPIPNEIPPPSFSMSGPNIVYHVGDRDLDEKELHQYILTIPDGQGRVELYKLYVRAKKYKCKEIKSDLDLIRSLGLYEEVNAKISPVLKRAESNLLKWGRSEDLLNGDPRAKNLDKIALLWGAFVCDHFRCSNESEHNLGAIASAARSVPDYTMARRLVNENILGRLEKVTGSQYRRKRYATVTDWYGIRGMAPIHEPIDSMRLFAVGMHLGEFDVLEEGIV